MHRRPRLRALWASVLQGLYLAALVLALVSFALRVAQGADAVRRGYATPAEAISAITAWLQGDERGDVADLQGDRP